MAKQESTGFFEQHVEKVVLLVCACVLVFAVVHWVLGSPRTVEALTATGSTTEVSPEKVDEQINQAAERIWRRHSQATAEVEPVYPGPNHFERVAATPFSPLLSDLAYMGDGAIPLAEDTRVELEPVTLAQVARRIPAPSPPAVWVGQELRRLSEGDLTDENVAHGAADFNWQKLRSQWQTLLRPRGIRVRPVVLRVEVQRQEVLPDGTYGQAETIRTIRAPGPEGQLAEVPELPDFTGQNTQAVADAIDQIEQGYQAVALRPRYWQVWWGGTNQWIDWRRHLPRTDAMETYATTGVDAPPEEDTIRPAPRRSPGPPSRREEDRGSSRREAIRREMEEEARYGRSVEDRGRRSPPIGREYEDERRRAPRRRAPRREEEDEERFAPRDDEEAVAGGAAPPPLPPVPPMGRLVEGKKVLWFHDVDLKTRKTYQYRVRMVLVNPLYGKQIASVVKSEQALRAKDIASPWSKWSSAQPVPHPTEFFLTGYDSTSGTVQVSVFTRTMGRFVSRTFSIRRGQSIGSRTEMRVPVPTPAGETTRELRTVDFRTAAVALEVDFNRQIPNLGAFTGTTVALVYLDENGQVRTRLRSQDQASERLKELEKLAP